MIVDDLYVGWPFRGPDETDAPLLNDADSVLSFPIIFQCLEAVAGRDFQIVKNCRPVQLRQLSEGRSFDIHPAPDALALMESLGVAALEASYRHGWR